MARTVLKWCCDFWHTLVPPDRWAGLEARRQASRVAAFDLAMFVWVWVFAPVYVALGAPECATILACGGVLLLTSLVALQRGHPPTLCGNILCFACWYTYTALAILTSGQGAPVAVWYASMPVIAVYLCGVRSGIFWTLASIVTVTGFSVADRLGFVCPNLLTPAAFHFLQYLGLVGVITCVFLLVYLLTRIEYSAREVLHETNCRLEVQTYLDDLTGVANRRCFDHTLEDEWKRHGRSQLPLSLALIDVDWFKRFNDCRGHLAGDNALRTIAQAIRATARRPGDMVARFGGEEFAIILPDTDEQQSLHVAENVRRHVRGLEIPYSESSTSEFITVSVGIATVIPDRTDSHREFVHSADLALYDAKANGRNRTVHAAQPTEMAV